MNQRGWKILGLLLGWAICLGLARSILAPATGAATIAQLDTDASFFSAMSVISIINLVTLVISILFAVLLYRVLRAK